MASQYGCTRGLTNSAFVGRKEEQVFLLVVDHEPAAEHVSAEAGRAGRAFDDQEFNEFLMGLVVVDENEGGGAGEPNLHAGDAKNRDHIVERKSVVEHSLDITCGDHGRRRAGIDFEKYSTMRKLAEYDLRLKVQLAVPKFPGDRFSGAGTSRMKTWGQGTPRDSTRARRRAILAASAMTAPW